MDLQDLFDSMAGRVILETWLDEDDGIGVSLDDGRVITIFVDDDSDIQVCCGEEERWGTLQ